MKLDFSTFGYSPCADSEKRGGGGAGSPDPPPQRISQVAIGFLRNTGTDPSRVVRPLRYTLTDKRCQESPPPPNPPDGFFLYWHMLS